MSEVAWVGCIEAMMPSAAKRGISAASRICACSLRLRSVRALGTSRSTRAKVSMTTRLARSPMAWMQVWKPASAAARVNA